jgi:phage terminase small subunit
MPQHRKPRGAKILQGTFRKDRDNPDEPIPMPLPMVPPPPQYLSATAKKEWKRVIGWLVENKIVGTENLSCLEVYCRLYSAIRENGVMSVPASYIAQYRALAGSFCLTPEGRAKAGFPVGDDHPDPANPFAEFRSCGKRTSPKLIKGEEPRAGE